MDSWRLLDTPPMTAAENMALDETLVELKGEGLTPNTIHFLQFSPRAVLVGYHQSIQEEIRTDYCASHGIDINRRVTGGGAIFFDESQLGWEVICDKEFFNVRVPTQKLFRALCDPVITALDLLGVKSSFRPRNDIEVDGRKISGTGGTESDGAFLFQGTMLTDFDVDTMLRSLRIPVEKLKAKEIDSVKERVTCLKWELGYTPALEEIKKAIRAGFEKHLDVRLEPAGLEPAEKRLFQEKLEYYRSSAWIDMVHPVFDRHEVVQSAYKNDEGLVRFTVTVDLPKKRIKDLYITGDFLSFPSRALFDLESKLRGTPLEEESLHRIIGDFFENGLIRIPGMTRDDFLKPLDQILRKVEITKYGIPLEYCNLISVTNGTFEEVLKREPSVLLLPYCSKDLRCDLRHKKGCRACGDCSIGPAWTMGRTKKMKVVCIVSFEDLMEELEKMKAAGVSAYIGCCCQPFFTKHVDDFERAGIPGILLDIDDTTCYELDQAKEAYAGRFSSQTQVNLDLLNAVMNTRVA
ncbi:MAG: lipoate--protein ligase [Thermoplasmata archaeon]|nr:MAG: lipoate--protein ligase [Thermoplasmata archaeon]